MTNLRVTIDDSRLSADRGFQQHLQIQTHADLALSKFMMQGHRIVWKSKLIALEKQCDLLSDHKEIAQRELCPPAQFE